MRIILFVLLLLGLIGKAHAVIGGTPTSISSVSTIELKIRHKVWSGRDGGYIFISGTCSSLIAGVKPLTLLTASHCFRDPDLDETTQLPKLELRGLPTGAAPPRLVRAIYTPIQTVNQKGAMDIAVLVFDGAIEDSWRPVPLAVGARPQEILICGFGYSAKEGPSDLPRCARKETIRDLMDFSLFVPMEYQSSDPSLYAKFETQFRSKAERFHSMADLIGVSRLRAGAYSIESPMPREGDSGGPWFTVGANGGLQAVALTSFGETFFRKNRVWPAFQDSSIPTDDLTYAMYGVRLDTSEARVILDQARSLGADISFTN